MYVIIGEFDLIYLFVRRKFNWGTSEYSMYLGVSSIISIIGKVNNYYTLFHAMISAKTVLLFINFRSGFEYSLSI